MIGSRSVPCSKIQRKSRLENFSRSVLASAISLRQDTEAFFALFYQAVRAYGVPEILASTRLPQIVQAPATHPPLELLISCDGTVSMRTTLVMSS